MKSSDKTERFVQSLFAFKADDRLCPPASNEALGNGIRIAASSDAQNTEAIPATRLNSDGDVLVRIFRNVKSRVYDLYFIAEDDRFSRFPILVDPKSFKFFIIHKDGHAQIPFSSSIDPRKEELSITYPLESGLHEIPTLESDGKDSVICLDKDKMSVTFTKDVTKALFIFTDSEQKEITRLVPVRNGEAVVKLPEGVAKEFRVSGY